ncbi:hypothetical protein Pmar_PMAR003700 [Perkinsus marinus ATCC 50983]|uniref:Uncharacterized protein n=1 Tax=Perkinsus marinus (strain ATCC 50983 / TXsc) TaxID=423536 RepID=C5KI25_PERM5|nr:hypothetical protein Pmar_PMAR003700 [Perkinsus marinus ATCC 50983]EER16237.1 hypothetical protein Pmar_PMAR003700 [Perkinsus marinus ATCC 50983]|eukprot:XP_002784441.1 hypothetical protein Pmar_PMAR003700 [Perkinsus marinus ATCC 50983]
MAITGAKELPSPGPHEPTISDLVQMNEVKLEQLMAERREVALRGPCAGFMAAV